jgi:G3E family GTPase
VFNAGAAAMVEIEREGAKHFQLEVPSAGRYVLFTQGRPEDFVISLAFEGSPLVPVSVVDYVAGHVHDEAVTSVSITQKGSLDTARFRAWLDELVHQRGDDIYRAKGIFDDGSANRVVVHAVHELLDLRSDRGWRDGEERVNQLVVIGRDLDEKALRRGFLRCVNKATTSASRAGTPRVRRVARS